MCTKENNRVQLVGQLDMLKGIGHWIRDYSSMRDVRVEWHTVFGLMPAACIQIGQGRTPKSRGLSELRLRTVSGEMVESALQEPQ